MMTIFSVNLGNFGSTGKIMSGISEIAEQAGYAAYQAYPGGRMNHSPGEKDIVICSDFSKRLCQKLSYYTGLNGCFAFFSTLKLLKKLDAVQPDILHLHNLHNSYINLPLLFRYIKKHDIRVVWTLHDCWSFTGHCPHFTMVKCGKWKTGCFRCPQYKGYPESIVDDSKFMYKRKKKWFTGVKDMTLVTPSEWLAGLVRQSFLKDYPVMVIHNGIDLSVFRPTPSDFREKHGIPKEKTLLLGVAFGWGKRKGLDVFVSLHGRLDPEKYQIVLVGTDDAADRELPEGILSVHRTQNQTELAEIYTAADLFVNPTREEVFGLVNAEALACGTPVLTFETGGSPEIPDETCGSVVECDDLDALESEILRIGREKPFSAEACLKRAQSFDMNEKYKEYVKLYEDRAHCTERTL